MSSTSQSSSQDHEAVESTGNAFAKWFSVRNIVAIGIGAAVFFVLATWVNIPTGVPNTNVKVAEAWSALIAIIFGPAVGFFVVLIGDILSALVYGGFWWSWIIADAVYALLIGLVWRRISIESSPFDGRKILLFNVTQVIAGVISWVLLAPIGDIIIYSEPADKVFLQGVTAFISNSLTIGIITTLLLLAYNKSRVKAGSVKKED